MTDFLKRKHEKSGAISSKETSCTRKLRNCAIAADPGAADLMYLDLGASRYLPALGPDWGHNSYLCHLFLRDFASFGGNSGQTVRDVPSEFVENGLIMNEYSTANSDTQTHQLLIGPIRDAL